jgi:glutathione reductase (NADPH)
VVTADRLYLDDGPLPARLVVLGGGWQATGAAGLFRALGCEVTLVFADADPLAGFDAELRRHVGDALAGAGVRLRPQTRVSAVTAGGRRRAVETDAGVLAAERVVLAGDAPPIPNTDHLGLETLGVATTPDGAIYVDTRYATRRAGVFAIGDCADHAGHGLAPATFDYASIAAVEGRRLAEHLAGAPPAPLDYDRQPLIVPGRPALATVGLAEDRARALGLRVAARGRTLDGDRFAKLVVDADGGEVLGCHLAGAGAGAALERVVAALAVDADAATLARRLAAPAAAADPFAEELVAQARELG